MIDNKNRSAEEAKSIQVAEESRELDWKSKSFIASIFMGDLDMSLAHPFPEQDPLDAAEGDEICRRVEAWAKEHLDGEAIDAAGEIPAHVWKGLNDLGLFGIKISKEYGGLGMSQTNYMRILGVIARYCGATCATLSAHQSIGVPQPLKLFGTDEQKKKYLPRFAAGEITAFALTEATVGSDPANMVTEATPNEDGSWTLNGEKLWCTNGVIADALVVMARTPPKVIRGKERKQISAFIVETGWAGVEVVHRCEFMGIRAIENGIVRFTDVRVPAENIIGQPGDGLRLALTTLNDGRLGIPATTAAAAGAIARFSARWAKSRFQWGKTIGEHEAGADKLARVVSGAYAMQTMADYCGALSDRGDVDIRMEAATAKMLNTEIFWSLTDTALQLRGGRGFETAASLEARGEVPFPMERGLRDARINRIVEGTTDVMHLFLAREALDKHLTLAGGFFKKGGDIVGTLLKCARFYPGWYAKLWLGGLTKSFGDYDRRLAGHLRAVERRTRKLGRKLFHQMLLKGPKLEMRQLTLARMVEIGGELALMALVASRVQGEMNRGETANVGGALYWLEHRRLHVDGLFAKLSKNEDAAARRLATEAMAAAEALAEPDTSHLRPIAHDRGRDLTSGAQTERGVAPAGAEERAAK